MVLGVPRVWSDGTDGFKMTLPLNSVRGPIGSWLFGEIFNGDE